MNEELNRKLAEWRGFTWYDEPCPYEGCSGHCGWRYPDGTTIHPLGMRGLPDFTNSLDACFKWLVLDNCSVCFNHANSSVVCMLTIPRVKRYGSDTCIGKAGEGEDALALCLAIEKLIDGGK